MTRTSSSNRTITLLLILSFLHGVSTLASDGLTLLSLLSHWTFVPPVINFSWNASDSTPCSWIGVQCNHANSVISLNLTGEGIFGQLGPEIGNLHQLQTLVLLGNGLSGKVPLELSNCSLLQYLDLSSNSFSGKIPYSFKNLQNLQYLELSSNLLSGEIPDSLFQMPSLEVVSLHSNLLSGPIPTNIGNLTQLSRLFLYGNLLSGEIPSSIGNCTKLEYLELSFNRLTGEIPVTFWRIPSLVHVLVHNNSLSGELPLEMTMLKRLKNVSLFDNQFSGVLPQSLGINSSLVTLDCMNNKFTGNIPTNLCFGKRLAMLNMGFNQLQGGIPSDVGRCVALRRLILSENDFTGSLPVFEGNPNLKYLDISKNNISGQIPATLGNCTNLTYINLSMNKITGLIPSELGKLVNLTILDLSHNYLEGPLPLQLSNCAKMNRFDVGFNFLNGSLPSSLRNWKNITTLVLRDNHFTRGIPDFWAEFSNLRELQLGGNMFGGKIPNSMGKLHNLFYGLNLSANGLVGDVPREIGKLVLLQSLDISLNNLTGSIEFFRSLVSLIEVNISYNVFSGPIPTQIMTSLDSSPSAFMGNPLLCVSCLSCIKTSYLKQCVDKSSDLKGIGKFQIVMIEIGSSIFISAMLLNIIRMRLHRKETETESGLERGAREIGIIHEKEPSSLTNLVLKATENLNERYVIGTGAHGIVYKANLGQQVFAVKKIKFGENKKKRLSIMLKEIEVLGRFKHRNLVKYADYWVGQHYGLILFEFMENGSLHDILHVNNPPPPLTWCVRFNIAVGIAQGLAYLHYDCIPPIVHRDIKPQNILLDAVLEPRVADLGTALHRNLAEDSYSHTEARQMLSSKVIGTPGYIAPENAYAIVPSRKSDVYSYGVVLLELITRKKVLVPRSNDEEHVTHLVTWARSIWLKTGKIEKIADSYLVSAFPNSVALAKQVTEVLLLALQCTERDLRNRPTMKDIIRFYKRNLFKRCDEVEYGDEVAANTTPQPFSNEPRHQEESNIAAAKRQRDDTFNVEIEPQDYRDSSFWKDADKFHLGVSGWDEWSLISNANEVECGDEFSANTTPQPYSSVNSFPDWDDWKLMSGPTTGIVGLLIGLIGNGKVQVEKVAVPALIVPKITFVWPTLIFLPSAIGPILTKPFNWFFLSRWGQYMYLQKSLYTRPKSYYILNANQIEATVQMLVPSLRSEAEVTHLVSWDRSIKPTMLLALQCTEQDLQKRQPTKGVTVLNKKDLLRCDEVKYADEVAANITPQPYSSSDPSPNVPLVSIDPHLCGESSRVAFQRPREVTFDEKTESHDYSDFSFWQDVDKFQLGVYDWDDWKLMAGPTTGIDGLVIGLMDNNKIQVVTVVVAGLIFPKVTYAWPTLVFLPSVTGPILNEPFNWFFLSHWGQYMHLQKSLYTQPKSYYCLNANKIKATIKMLVPSLKSEEEVTHLVSLARSAWLQMGKIEKIAISCLASVFPNSIALAMQVTAVLFLALQCTQQDLQKRQTMKDFTVLNKKDLLKLRCDEMEYGDEVSANTTPQPYSSFYPFLDVPVVRRNTMKKSVKSKFMTSIDPHLYGESSRAAVHRQREFTFDVETEPHDYSGFSFCQDAHQFQLGGIAWDEWSFIPKPMTGTDGLVIN